MANIKGAPVAAPDALTFEVSYKGSTVAVLVAPARTFSSGKSGFGSYGKLMLPDGRTIQSSINMVLVEKK